MVVRVFRAVALPGFMNAQQLPGDDRPGDDPIARPGSDPIDDPIARPGSDPIDDPIDGRIEGRGDDPTGGLIDGPTDGTVVRFRDVVAVLGGFPALAGATLDVGAGEILLLEGPNGAGKTTLLRTCAGLVPVARGAATVLGFDLTADRNEVRRHVGLLGHQNGLYVDLTVHDNVRFWGATVRASDDEVASAMQRLGVDERLADVPVRKLSAGQKRRTALACLVARRARLWLLDEPHAGLDAASRDELDRILRQAAASGATVVVASHEIERASALATRVVRVVAGQVRQVPG
jgi:heme ABC exporter ATP-binding subunit CcmA